MGQESDEPRCWFYSTFGKDELSTDDHDLCDDPAGNDDRDISGRFQSEIYIVLIFNVAMFLFSFVATVLHARRALRAGRWGLEVVIVHLLHFFLSAAVMMMVINVQFFGTERFECGCADAMTIYSFLASTRFYVWMMIFSCSYTFKLWSVEGRRENWQSVEVTKVLRHGRHVRMALQFVWTAWSGFYIVKAWLLLHHNFGTEAVCPDLFFVKQILFTGRHLQRWYDTVDRLLYTTLSVACSIWMMFAQTTVFFGDQFAPLRHTNVWLRVVRVGLIFTLTVSTFCGTVIMLQATFVEDCFSPAMLLMGVSLLGQSVPAAAILLLYWERHYLTISRNQVLFSRLSDDIDPLTVIVDHDGSFSTGSRRSSLHSIASFAESLFSVSGGPEMDEEQASIASNSVAGAKYIPSLPGLPVLRPDALERDEDDEDTDEKPDGEKGLPNLQNGTGPKELLVWTEPLAATHIISLAQRARAQQTNGEAGWRPNRVPLFGPTRLDEEEGPEKRVSSVGLLADTVMVVSETLAPPTELLPVVLLYLRATIPDQQEHLEYTQMCVDRLLQGASGGNSENSLFIKSGALLNYAELEDQCSTVQQKWHKWLDDLDQQTSDLEKAYTNSLLGSSFQPSVAVAVATAGQGVETVNDLDRPAELEDNPCQPNSPEPLRGGIFKPSRFKSSATMGPVSVNLQMHITEVYSRSQTTGLRVPKVSPQDVLQGRISTASVGVPAAHSLGFKKGGLSRLSEALARCDQSTPLGRLDWLQQYLEVQKRQVFSMSNALPAWVSVSLDAFEARFRDRNEAWFRQIRDHGLLAHWASLLSTSGHEQGMLEDMLETLRRADVVFRFCRASSTTNGPMDSNGPTGSSDPGHGLDGTPNQNHDTVPSSISSPAPINDHAPTTPDSIMSPETSDTALFGARLSLSTLFRTFSPATGDPSSDGLDSTMNEPLLSGSNHTPRSSLSRASETAPTADVSGPECDCRPRMVDVVLEQHTRSNRKQQTVVVVLEWAPAALDWLRTVMGYRAVGSTGTGVKLRPVMFTLGVNERQTLANLAGHTAFQNSIISSGFVALKDYQRRLGNRSHIDSAALSTEMAKLHELVQEQCSQGGKSVALLTSSCLCARLLGGVRLTSCKSAKDRTSMFQTLEAATICRQISHRLDGDLDIQDLTARLRGPEGVRLQNCELNVGKRAYAFNRLQLECLPEELRPHVSLTNSSTKT